MGMIRPANSAIRPLSTVVGPEGIGAGLRDAAVSDGASILKAAEKRLQTNKTAKSTAAIQQLTREHGFGDEVQLALRLLGPAELGELLEGGEALRQKLAEVPDKDQLMRSLIAMLDPDVERLVSGLQRLNESTQAETAHEASESSLVAEVERRLQSNKTPLSVLAVEKLKKEFDLSDEVELGLRLLAPPQFEEFVAGDDALRQKLYEVSDRNHLMMSLISMLDPDVEKLVCGLQELEHGSKESSQDGHAGEDVVLEAEQRLQANKSPTSTAAIKKLTTDHGLSDEVQLGLRLLSPSHLQELLAGGEALRQKLKQVPDKNQLMVSLISMLDADVDRIVKGVLQIEAESSDGTAPGQAASTGNGSASAAAQPAKRTASTDSADDWDSWGDWRGDQKRWKGNGDKSWGGWKRDNQKQSWDGWKGSSQKQSWDGWNGDGQNQGSHSNGQANWQGRSATSAQVQPPSAPEDMQEKDADWTAPSANKKPPKCMICKGPHRAADCPKTK